jgi:hypothetical protein
MTFNPPISVTFTYLDADILALGLNESTLGVWVYDSTTGLWTAPPVTFRDTNANYFTIELTHFSTAVIRDFSTSDFDGDSCSDAAEISTNAQYGGQRDPQDPWDFYDVWTRPFGNPTGWERDRTIDLFGDILGIAMRFGAERPGGAPTAEEALTEALTPPASGDETGYNAAFDRGPQIGPEPWNADKPDGTINLFDDVIGAAYQFGHTCE